LFIVKSHLHIIQLLIIGKHKVARNKSSNTNFYRFVPLNKTLINMFSRSLNPFDFREKIGTFKKLVSGYLYLGTLKSCHDRIGVTMFLDDKI